jgi:photosystem II stability/assembly factor-like uncharacterized protein
MKTYLTLLIFLFFLSGNIKAQWYQQNSGTTVNLQSVIFIDESTGWVCGDSGKIIKTTNGGLDWLEQNSNTTDGLKAIQFVDQDNGWAYGQYQILRTTDGGYTWDVQNTNPSYIIALQFVDLNTGWLIYDILDFGSYIVNTTDGGITWTLQSHSPDGYYEAMFFLDENYGWVTEPSNGTVLKTTNGGNSWIQLNGNLYGTLMCIKFVDQMIGWVSDNTLGSYEISKSTDGGVSWFSQISDYGKFINSLSFRNSDLGYAAGFQYFVPPNPYYGFILKTANGGLEWSEQYRDEGELNSIFFINDTLGWAVGNEGKILVTENGGVTSVGDEENQTNPNDFLLYQNYPNPFNPKTNIQYAISNRQFVTIEVYDILGNEIAILIDEEKPAGEYEIEFNASSLPSGVYFYQLKAGSYIGTKKMILLK